LKEAIVESIRSNQVTVVAGETGSEKLRICRFFVWRRKGRDGTDRLYPARRIAAVSLARYVSTLFSDPGQVGYKIRFREDLTSDAKIKFMTDGILLAEIAGDPLLRQYDTLIIDEAHERSINVDFLLGFMRRILPQRPDLHLVISSATIDTRLFSRAFHNAPVITVPGRLFPVEIRYKPVIELWKGESMDSYVEGVVSSVQEIIDTEKLVIFLPSFLLLTM
jgi:ATP-dependent helicase HrpA